MKRLWLVLGVLALRCDNFSGPGDVSVSMSAARIGENCTYVWRASAEKDEMLFQYRVSFPDGYHTGTFRTVALVEYTTSATSIGYSWEVTGGGRSQESGPLTKSC